MLSLFLKMLSNVEQFFFRHPVGDLICNSCKSNHHLLQLKVNIFGNDNTMILHSLTFDD